MCPHKVKKTDSVQSVAKASNTNKKFKTVKSSPDLTPLCLKRVSSCAAHEIHAERAQLHATGVFSDNNILLLLVRVAKVLLVAGGGDKELTCASAQYNVHPSERTLNDASTLCQVICGVCALETFPEMTPGIFCQNSLKYLWNVDHK